MKYSNDVYAAFGFAIHPVKDGYKILQLQDNWIYEKLYYTKRECYEFIDFMIDFFKRES